MQNRHFDIAGPNPSPEELKKFDQEYTGYLHKQRREAIAGALAKKQSDLQVDIEKEQQQPAGNNPRIGPPMVITPIIVQRPKELLLNPEQGDARMAHVVQLVQIFRDPKNCVWLRAKGKGSMSARRRHRHSPSLHRVWRLYNVYGWIYKRFCKFQRKSQMIVDHQRKDGSGRQINRSSEGDFLGLVFLS